MLLSSDSLSKCIPFILPFLVLLLYFQAQYWLYHPPAKKYNLPSKIRLVLSHISFFFQFHETHFHDFHHLMISLVLPFGLVRYSINKYIFYAKNLHGVKITRQVHLENT